MRPAAQVGATLAGFVIEEVLGRGGMSEVYRAKNPRLGNAVALKVLDPELARDKLFRERFARESQIAASLDHPHVIPILDAGEEDGTPYIAMRFVDGPNLSELIARGPLPLEHAISIVSQAAGALDAAHERGLIHRDVKPANLLVDRHRGVDSAPHIYLSDFGVAKHALSRSGLTSTGQFVGTIDYVAPEQIEGKEIDARTDVYSLGCVLYECLTGAKPFVKDTNVAVMYAHLLEPPPQVTAVRGDLPAALDDVIARALAKNPDARFSSCGELAAAARAAAAGAPAPVVAPAPAVEAVPPVALDLPPMTAEVARPLPPARPPTAETAPQRKRIGVRIPGRVLVVAVVLAVAGLAAAAAAQTLNGSDPVDELNSSTGPVAPTTTERERPTRAAVPYVIGRKEAVAQSLLRRNFRTKLKREYDNVRKGIVLAQSVKAGLERRKGSSVVLIVSRGPRPTGSTGNGSTGNGSTGNGSNGGTTGTGSSGGTGTGGGGTGTVCHSCPDPDPCTHCPDPPAAPDPHKPDPKKDPHKPG